MPEAAARVVFADDDPILHRLLEVHFRTAGIEVETVHRGDDALRLVTERAPDALILDARMPGLDGPEVYRRLRAQPGFGSLPVIFLTGRSPDELAEYAHEPHVEVVTKPFDPATLLELVRAVIEAPA